MSYAEKARELFKSGYNCAQAVVLAFEDVTGIDNTMATKLSSSFGGGMGRLREVCGAVSGMFFVLVSLAFPLGWLTISGKLASSKVDALGLYMGIVVAGIGIGILIWKFAELGLWMIVPILMIAAGLAAVIKSLKHKQ